MKSIYLSTLFLGLGFGTANAQTAYDAANVAESDLCGTSRFVAMGGALGALGADMSTAGTNPAGVAMFRRADASITFGGIGTINNAQLGNNKTKATCDQAGGVFILNQGDDKWRNFNFAVNYQKKRNSFGNLGLDIACPKGYSQTYQIADMANEVLSTSEVKFGYDDPYANVYGGLVYDAIPLHHVTKIEGSGGKYESEHQEGILSDNYWSQSDKYWWDSEDAYKDGYRLSGVDAQNAAYKRKTWSNNSQVDLNFSTNYNDRLFIGFGVGFYAKEYRRDAMYSEYSADGFSYDMSNSYRMKAEGWDLKAGIIARPFEDSGFRVGLSVHTPIWYRMRDFNDLYIEMYSGDRNVNSTEYHSEEYQVNIRTPWTFGVSLGHTIGTQLALGAEYEYQDLGACRYSAVNGSSSEYIPEKNQDIIGKLKGQHTFKVGAEYKPMKWMAIRAGYNYVSSPYKNGAYNNLDAYGTYTETDYTNWKDIHRITAGLGFRYSNVYVDFAYQYQMQKGDFYPYYLANNYGENSVSPTSISNDRQSFVCTLGFRF